MPCASVMATRIEASLVLHAYGISELEGKLMYEQHLSSYMQKHAHRGLPAANAHVFDLSKTSVRTLTCVVDDERLNAEVLGDFSGIPPTKWACLPKDKRPYFMEGTLKTVSPDAHRRSVDEQNKTKALRMASGKFHVESAHGFVSAIISFVEQILISPATVETMAGAVMAVKFALSLRCNELFGWDDYMPSMADFDINGWICNFSAGSWSGDPRGAPRPMYHKVCLLPPHLVKRLLSILFVTDNEWLPDVRLYLARPGMFEKVMVDAGVRSFISTPEDAMGGHEKLTLKSVRSISASILPFMHTCTSFCNPAHAAEALACMQLGHASPGPTTDRYTCNRIKIDDAPASYLAQEIKLDDHYQMIISTKKRKARSA
jgi:hypothetical protein